jgi:hypothetical protein
MPIFVWIAIAIAALLIGAGSFAKALPEVLKPIVEPVSIFATALGGPIGYILAVAFLLFAYGSIIHKSKFKSSKGSNEKP